MPFAVLNGAPAERRKTLQAFNRMSGPRVLIVNYEQVKVHLHELNDMRFDVGIFDEAHYIKNYRSQRTKASQALKTGRSFMLTGTPVLNNVSELWPLLNRVDANKFSQVIGCS